METVITTHRLVPLHQITMLVLENLITNFLHHLSVPDGINPEALGRPTPPQMQVAGIRITAYVDVARFPCCKEYILLSVTRQRSVSPNVASNSMRNAEKSSKSVEAVSTKGANHASVGPVNREPRRLTQWKHVA
jgi:hypothetical protein